MSLDKYFPVPLPLAKVRICGSPWHGLVSGGVLALPGGGTRAYPQPSIVQRDTAGMAHRLKVPGIAEVVRTTEELAADAAAGKQWRNEAMLSGGNFDLCGHSLLTWIWVDAAGARWLVDCPEVHEYEHPLTVGLELTITLRRFGVVGPAPESHEYSVSLSDLGQSGGAVYVQSGGGAPVAVNRGFLRVDSLKADGSGALLMLHVRRERLSFPSVPTNTDIDPMRRWPLGWLELTLSGVGAAASIALSVARNRAQTLAMSRTPIPPITEWVAGMRRAGDGWETYLAAADPFDTEQQDLIGDGDAHGVQVWEGSWSYTVRRLLALWYTAAGGIEEVAVNVEWTATVDYPQVTVTEWRIERASSVAAAWTITLTRGAATIDTLAGNYATSDAPWFEWGLDGNSPPNNYTVGNSDGSYSEDVTFDGVTQATGRNRLSTEGSAWAATAPRGLAISHSSNGTPRGLNWGNMALAPELVGAALFMDYASSFPAWRVAMGNGDTFTGEIARQSGQVVGMRVHFQPASAPIYAGGGTWQYRQAATPGGSHGGVVSRPFVAGGEWMYASWCPYDGAVSWLNTSPVCFV